MSKRCVPSALCSIPGSPFPPSRARGYTALRCAAAPPAGRSELCPCPLPRSRPISARLPPLSANQRPPPSAHDQSAPASPPKTPPPRGHGSPAPARAKVAALPGRSREGRARLRECGWRCLLPPSAEPSWEGLPVDESSALLRLLALFPLGVS